MAEPLARLNTFGLFEHFNLKSLPEVLLARAFFASCSR